MYATVRVSREASGPFAEVELLVDTGATASFVPAAILDSVGIRPWGTEAFELANGEEIRRRVGGAVLSFAGRTGATVVVFGEEGDTPILGVLALEELGLQVDPRSGEIKNAKRLLVSTRRAVAAPELA